MRETKASLLDASPHLLLFVKAEKKIVSFKLNISVVGRISRPAKSARCVSATTVMPAETSSQTT